MKEKEVVEENEEEEEGIRKFCDTTYIHHKQTNTGQSENREHPPVLRTTTPFGRGGAGSINNL